MSSTISEHSIPLRWPPAWNDPRSLEILRGTPVNCLLDAPDSIAAAARARGLTAIQRAEAGASVQFLTDPVWPGIRPAKKSDGADAGPTGAPWVDSNGWNIRLTQALQPGKPIWVEAVPEKGTVQTDPAYMLAVAEPAAYGARWVIALDDAFAKGLAANESRLETRWKQMMSAVKFFDTRRGTPQLDYRANLAVVSDFSGSNEFLGKEFLNMADRRGLLYRVVPKHSAPQGLTSASGAILYIDEQPADAAAAAAMKQAVTRGVMLISSRNSGAANWGSAQTESPIPGYRARSLGKGRILIPEKDWQDPYVLASEVRILVGRRTDVLRLFNTGSMGALYTRSNDGQHATVHLLNHVRFAIGHPVSVAPVDRYSRAQVISLERQSPESVQISKREESFNEIAVPPFGVYSAVELTGAKEG